MLNISSDIVERIIEGAREFHAKEGVTITDPSGEWPTQILADHAGDATVIEVRSLIDDLEPAQQAELVAIMWVGRGDFGADEWDAAVQQARDSWNERTAEYVLGTPLASDYLGEGLNLLGFGQQ